MEAQNYANHRRLDPLFHGVLFGILVLTLGGAATNVYLSMGDHSRIYSASLIFVLTFAMILLFLFCRIYPLRAQDRAIRAEENLRHFALTGKLLDSRLSVKQIVALRFAPDEEFLELAARTAASNLAPDDIKQSIKNWKPDTYRI